MDPILHSTHFIPAKSEIYALPPLEKCLYQLDQYRKELSKTTLRCQENNLRHFRQYLQFLGIPAGDLFHDPTAWSVVTQELVDGFLLWLLNREYSVHTVNACLTTIRQYAKYMSWNGFISKNDYQGIRYQIDTITSEKKYRTREVLCRFAKETYPREPESHLLVITAEQAKALKDQPDTPQGRRDALMMCLLLDDGLKLVDLVHLARADFDLEQGTLVLSCRHGEQSQVIHLTTDSIQAAERYLCQDAPASGSIWKGSRKGKHGLTDDPMSQRAIIDRIQVLGQRVGLAGLRVRDCHLYWKKSNSPDGKVGFPKPRKPATPHDHFQQEASQTKPNLRPELEKWDLIVQSMQKSIQRRKVKIT